MSWNVQSLSAALTGTLTLFWIFLIVSLSDNWPAGAERWRLLGLRLHWLIKLLLLQNTHTLRFLGQVWLRVETRLIQPGSVAPWRGQTAQTCWRSSGPGHVWRSRSSGRQRGRQSHSQRLVDKHCLVCLCPPVRLLRTQRVTARQAAWADCRAGSAWRSVRGCWRFAGSPVSATPELGSAERRSWWKPGEEKSNSAGWVPTAGESHSRHHDTIIQLQLIQPTTDVMMIWPHESWETKECRQTYLFPVGLD